MDRYVEKKKRNESGRQGGNTREYVEYVCMQSNEGR